MMDVGWPLYAQIIVTLDRTKSMENEMKNKRKNEGKIDEILGMAYDIGSTVFISSLGSSWW